MLQSSNKHVETAIKKKKTRTSLVVQWLRLHAFTVGCVGSIPGGGPNILNAM